MDFYSLFPGFVEINASPGLILVIDKLFGETSYDTVLNWKMALMFVYGSLPRPSDVESFGVCMWFLTLLSSNVDSGTLFIVDHIALWKHLASTYALSEGELRLESLMHIVQYVQELCTDSEDNFRPQNFSRQGESLKVAIDTSYLDLYQADCYCILHLVSLDCEVGDIGSATFFAADVFDRIHVTTTAVRALRLCLFIKTEADYFESTGHQFLELNSLIQQMEISFESCCIMLAFLYHAKFRFYISANMRSFAAQSKISSWIYLHDAEDKDDLANMGFFFDCQVLLQRQNRDCGFIGYTFVARSTWFRSILEFLYCSLPRPPEDLCDFNFPTSHGVFKSKMQVPSILRGSIRDIDLVGLVMV